MVTLITCVQRCLLQLLALMLLLLNPIKPCLNQVASMALPGSGCNTRKDATSRLDRLG